MIKKDVKLSKAPRSSNFELLRILAMMAIIAGHFFWQSGAAEVHGRSLSVVFFGTGSTLSINLFLFLACWFMVDVEFRWSRILLLYSTVISYTIPLTIVALLCGATPSVKDVARGFMPFTGRALWFASAYISLVLLTPWLHHVFELSRKSLIKLIVVLTVLISGVSTLPDAQDTYLCNFFWFIYAYILMGYIKRHVKIKLSKFQNLCLLIGGLALHWVLSVCYAYGPEYGKIGKICFMLSQQYLLDCKVLPTFAISLLIFLFFKNIDIGSIQWINTFARSAFSVYVIHQTPAFFPFMWKSICMSDKWINSPLFPLGFLCVVIGIYLACFLIDSIRREIVNMISYNFRTGEPPQPADAWQLMGTFKRGKYELPLYRRIKR